MKCCKGFFKLQFFFGPIISFSFAITWLHLEHFSVFSGRYAGKKTCNFDSEMFALRNIFSTSIILQSPQFLHLILSFAFTVIPQNRHFLGASVLLVTLKFEPIGFDSGFDFKKVGLT